MGGRSAVTPADSIRTIIMNIRRAKQEIKDTIEAYLARDENGESRIPEIRQRPVLLMGPPGVGKTQIMEQIASECDIGLVAYTITHHTRQSAVGLPYILKKNYGGKECSVTEYTMSEIIASVYDRMEESGRREGILFIDEINCVSETLAPTMLQFLQCKTFGNQKVPEGWVIVAAGNPPEYNKSVRDFDVVTLDRVKVMNIEPDYSVWKEYAHRACIHEAILSYLDIHRDNFYRCETTVDGMRFVTARGWEDLSEMLIMYEELGKEMDEEVIGQYIQYPAIAKDFAAYLELYHRYRADYRTSEILAGTILPGTLQKLRYAPFDERVEIISLLLSELKQKFLELFRGNNTVSHVYEVLKGFRDAPAQEAENEALLGRLTDDLRAKTEKRIAAGQSRHSLESEYRPVFRALDSFCLLLKERSFESRAQAFEALKAEFSSMCTRLDEEGDAALKMLEYAFDFMETAFGESQEMVYFVTELSADPYAVAFLKEHECPRYYRYSKSLLFEDAAAQVRKELDAIRSEMNGEE